MKLHWQVDWKICIDGSEPKAPMLAICGAGWPRFADRKENVTCKNCLKKIKKEEDKLCE